LRGGGGSGLPAKPGDEGTPQGGALAAEFDADEEQPQDEEAEDKEPEKGGVESGVGALAGSLPRSRSRQLEKFLLVAHRFRARPSQGNRRSTSGMPGAPHLV